MWKELVDRQRGIVNFSDALIEAIGRTRVLVAGAGGNGAVLDFLVRTGFQRFVIIDFDVVEATNLNRLPFTPAAVGKTKAEAWKEYLQAVNPACEVTMHCRRVTKNDEAWLTGVIAGVDIVALGMTDIEANFLIPRVCHRLRKRMVVGPGTSNCWAVSTFTHEGDVSLERVGRFGTEGIDAREIDYQAVLPAFMRIYMFPGRTERLYPETLQRVQRGEIAPRNCKIFVSLVNAAACWEIVKNTAVLNGLPLENTRVIEFPLVQVFDPFRGSAYYWDAEKNRIGIPNWLTGKIRWHKAP
ncbi:MAG: ThiF family adenylyltransferase [Syntrophaceae bacterium]|nr:ThiF family adenylyltransferase [Syntrophaceae bacterium]